MGRGIFLIVVGAILALAVRQGDQPAVNLDVVGIILMAAGLAVALISGQGTTQERVVTTIDDVSDPSRPTHTVIEQLNEHEAGAHPISPDPDRPR